MEEIKNAQPDRPETAVKATETATQESEPEKSQKEMQEILKQRMEEVRKRAQEANEAMSQGKGRLSLETPIQSGDKEIKELVYDFTALTGMEYTDAMDNDMNANSSAYHRITYRQALSLFAKASAKQMDNVDMEDIVSRIGVTDAVEGVQLATLFFTASTRAGRLRISKK